MDHLNSLSERQWVDIHGGHVKVDSLACVHVCMWDHDCSNIKRGLSWDYVKLERL